MIHPQPDQKRIVFLFSDTGGGHRSAAEAIIEALQLEYPGTRRIVKWWMFFAITRRCL